MEYISLSLQVICFYDLSVLLCVVRFFVCDRDLLDQM